MSKDYVSARDAEFLTQLIAFNTALPTYAGILGISPAQVAAHAADTLYFQHLNTTVEILTNAKQQWSAWRAHLRDGQLPHTSYQQTTTAEPPTLPIAPPVVPPGIESRFRALSRLIKALPAYNSAIGKGLGIVAETSAPPDLTTLAPVLRVRANGATVHIHWDWQRHSRYLDLCEIHVDRNDGRGFTLLTIDSTPGYDDTHPFPASPDRWFYKAIYRVNDRQTGKWSQTVPLLLVQG